MQWLRTFLGDKKQADFAAALGIPPSRVSEMLKGARRLQPGEIPRAAAFLGVSEGRLLALVAGRPDPGEPPLRGLAEPAAPAPGPPRMAVTEEPARIGRPDIPVWASAQAGDDGAIILVPDPVDYIYRSERMREVKNPFAFQIVGSSMSPALEHGDQVVINPALLLRTGVNAVFIQEQPDGTYLAMVKRLLRITADHWQVRQFEPVKDFSLSRKKWARAHVIAEIRKAGL